MYASITICALFLIITLKIRLFRVCEYRCYLINFQSIIQKQPNFCCIKLQIDEVFIN